MKIFRAVLVAAILAVSFAYAQTPELPRHIVVDPTMGVWEGMKDGRYYRPTEIWQAMGIAAK